MIGLTSPSIFAVDTFAAPKPLNSTLLRERFIALHIILVRINPLAPTSEPDTISRLLFNTKPAAQAANPEYEFSRAMTTGISAPPIGIVIIMPNNSDRPITANSQGLSIPGFRQNMTAAAIIASTSAPLNSCWPPNWIALLGSLSLSLP